MSKKSRKEVEAIVSGMGVFTSIISNLVELVKKFGGTMEYIYRLATPEGNETLEAIARVIVGGVDRVRSEFFNLISISGNESLILDECDGSEILADASDMFTWIDDDFRNYGADQKGPATGKTPVHIYEMTKDATFVQMFGSISADMRKICLTQAQIKGFVRKYRNWLRTDGYATFFLFESNGHFFVASVNVNSDGNLKVHVRRFEYSDVWSAEDRRRVVVPQLA